MNLPKGFLSSPPKTAKGKAVSGRFTCQDVQFTGEGEDLFGTFTITARELLDVSESNLLWTDQDVQRGIKPEASNVPRQLSLAQGYPDQDSYIFIEANADEIAEKLLHGRKVYLSPLTWNLRPGNFEAFLDDKNESLTIFSGKVFLPDSHHRHQGIIKAAKIFRENPEDYHHFSLSKQFKVDIYFLSKEDEGNFFFDKNQLTRQTAKSKAFDLTTQDALALLAKEIINNSAALSGNVNRVTDRLTAKNADLLTLSTLREMSKSIAPGGDISEPEIEGLAALVGGFFDKIRAVRPELGHLSATDRHAIRQSSLVGAAVMMHGYAALARDYVDEVPKVGSAKASAIWDSKLRRLASSNQYSLGQWSGDLFQKDNPIWAQVGIMKPSNRGTLAQVNNGATRAAAARVLRAVVASDTLNLTEIGDHLA